jgi:transcriptional regulator with AAA-type ATPase domain
LVESELFGYEKGSHSTAKASSPGIIESAAGGTVFLDEIGEMPMSAQAKLLVAVDSDATSGHVSVRRIGGRAAQTVDVRLVLGTNRNLHSMVARGEFRLDLLGRIKTHTIELPALSTARHRIVPAYIANIQEAGVRYPNKVQFALTPKAHQLLRSFAASADGAWVWNYRDIAESAHRLTFGAFSRGKPTRDGVYWLEAADVESEVGRLTGEWRKHTGGAIDAGEWAPLHLALVDGAVDQLTILQRQEAMWLLQAREATTGRAAAWRWLVERNVYRSSSRKINARTPDTVRFDSRWKKFQWRRGDA